MNKMISFWRYFQRKRLTFFDIAYCLCKNSIVLTRNLKTITKSKRVIILANGGYGHTVLLPDIARRLYSKENPLVIILSERGRHNWRQSEIWPDIDVIHLLKSNRIRTTLHKYLVRLLVDIVLFLLQKRDVLVLDQTKPGYWKSPQHFYKRLEEKYLSEGKNIEQPDTTPIQNTWVAYYYKLISDTTAARLCLPDYVRKTFYRLVHEAIPENQGIITFYHRIKFGGLSSVRRNGGLPEDYRAMINHLADNNYVVLLTGDTKVVDWPADLSDQLYDADKLGMDKDWYRVASCIECDRFIGEAGGGNLLPIIEGKPSLHINVYPFGVGRPSTLMLYKRLLSEENKLMPLETCFANHWWTQNEEMPGITIRNNSSQEILSAVKEFLSVPRDAWIDYIVPQDIFPKGGLPYEAPSRLAKVQEYS